MLIQEETHGAEMLYGSFQAFITKKGYQDTSNANASQKTKSSKTISNVMSLAIGVVAGWIAHALYNKYVKE